MVIQAENALAVKLKDSIRLSGPITIEHFMSACLMDPDFGYYQTERVFGQQGDFITAPEISQTFGELIGIWVAVVWQSMDKPEAFNLIELGPGRGTLMSDAMRAMKIMPGAFEAANVHLIEQSANLRDVQKETLGPNSHELHWHQSLKDVPKAPGILLANEFFDALPIRQFMKVDDQWFERLIGMDENMAFQYILSDNPVDPELDASVLSGAKPGDIVETRHIPRDLLPNRADNADHPFAALIIDYGHTKSAVGDTFQAIKNHAYCDPLKTPGEADVTAHVDFQALANITTEPGYVVETPTTQAEFLCALGIIERAQALIEKATMVERNKIENQIARLISEAAMGTRFKVLGVRSQTCPPLPGFTSQT